MFPLVSQAWQSWKSAKAVALLVVVAFAVGIGSATAIYTVIDTLLLKPVPYAQGGRFVSILGASLVEPGQRSALSVPDVLEIQQRARSYDVFGWMTFANYNLTAPGQPLYLNAVGVTPRLANGLGVNPRIGRWFRDEDGGLVTVVSHGLWQRLGADPSLAGKTVTLNGRIYTVTGIMPPGFELPLAGYYGEANIDLWYPLDPQGRGQDRTSGNNFCYGRLRPGVSVAEADAETRRIAADIARREPATHPSFTARADDLGELITKEVRPILLLLFAAAELLLLIACANVCGLLLARSIARARETAVRVALGARLRQLALRYFLEGLCVSLPGALAGLAFSLGAVRVLIALVGAGSPRTSEIGMDWRVVAFALVTALLAGALISLAPLWQAARTRPNEVLNEGVRASAGTRSRRVLQSFVVTEVALAFVLLAASAVLVLELYHLVRVSPGFDPGHLLTFKLAFDPQALPGKPSRASYETRLVQALEAIPGVSGVGFVNQLPLNGCCYATAIFPEGAWAKPSTGERVSFLPVNPGYWRTMRIPLRRGRLLNEHDTAVKFLPVVINQATARRYWANQEPVGAFGHFVSPKGDRFQVLGVVGDVKNNGLDAPTVPEIYLPSTATTVDPLNFVVRSALPPGTLVPEVRRAIRNVNPGQPIHEVRMMDDILRESVWLKRVASTVMTFFALAALLMATIGAYGVVSYSVRQRTVEIGTRMALGAVSRDLLYLVVGSGLKMAAWGVALGGLASIGVGSLLVRQYGVQNLGWLPFALSAAIIAAVAMASSFFPAWRATLLSPMVAIRNEPASMWQAARHGLGRWFEEVSHAVAGAGDAAAVPDQRLLTGFIDASRRAGSFREALAAALESLRASLGAQSALLLENSAAGEYRATIAVPDRTAAACSIPGQGLLLNRLRFYPDPFPVTSGDLEVWQRWAAGFKPQHLAEIETLRQSAARLAIPLRTRDEVPGLLLLGAPAGREEYSQAEKRLLRGCADQFALMLENARLTDRVLEQEKLRRDIALAAEVQKRLLPRQSLETEAASFAAVNLPARSVGGDYYDFLDPPGHRTGIALADVAGKGVAAALIMSVVQASLRVISLEPGISLPQLVAKMNHFLYRSTGTNSYATFFYAQLDESSRQLRYVNAGHNPPYLLRADSAALEELVTGGTIIGMFPQASYEEGAVDLHSGDVLIVFTDGVTEALNPAGEEFGEERLKGLLREAAALAVEEMSARIAQEMKSWMQDAPQHDDLTFVLMKVK